MALLTPWAGVYAVVATLEVLGMARWRLLGAVGLGLALYAVALVLGASALGRFF